MDHDLNNVFFSVIMPAYNAGDFIGSAIQSVLKQGYANWELIIVNDGSTDGTRAIVEVFTRQDKRISLLDQQNKGLGAARNTGMAAAVGKWIAFLDADDHWVARKLELQYRLIKNRADIDVLFSDGYCLAPDSPIPLYYPFKVAQGYFTGQEMFDLLFTGNQIPVLSACIKTEWKDIVGKQYENKLISGSEDWDFWLRLASAGAIFYGMPDRLFHYRVHPGSMSARVLEQRTGSAMVLLANYNSEVLSDVVSKQLMNDTRKLAHELEKAGKIKESKILLVRLQQVFHLAGLTPRPVWISFNSYLLTFTSIKRGMKKVFLRFVEFLFFKPYKIYLKHAHNLSAQFVRWNLGPRLDTQGPFFISQNAGITAAGEDVRMITHGIHINEFSRINLSGKASYMYTGSEVVVNRFCNFNIWEGRLIIGNHVLFNNYCSLNCMEEITIGDNTWLGEGVRLYDHNHLYNDPVKPFTQQGMKTGKISIGQNCWIGSNTVILSNVTIGDNCIIGANNLIYKSLNANTIIKASAMENIETVIYGS